MSTLVSRDLWWWKVYGELYGDKGFPGSARGPLGTVGCQLVGSHLQGAHKQITDRCGKILGLRQKACVRPCSWGGARDRHKSTESGRPGVGPGLET